ncbi:hypothetical protein BCR35DRAFT_290347 [Leucosporidium creatinivorum]|uniref:B30.2/SPRY domain-containing protein n=1 Tax=Leucosporidium creatinivorum TaxID=106004 RepID=A0A1Y2FL57_9BASI|nr:hypothetical protein BCR35DRAFT_290347 [Leucosporidium creatinivorum]
MSGLAEGAAAAAATESPTEQAIPTLNSPSPALEASGDIPPELNSRPSQKRKHSPSTDQLTPSAASPSAAPLPAPNAPTGEAAAEEDSSTVANPPTLIPHTSNLPPSSFEFYQTRGHPISRNGYRYTTCGPSPSSSLPIPIQRLIENPPLGARFSWEDRSTFVLLTEDARTITAEKGWRAARANVGVREGNWYWEVKAERCGGEGANTGAGLGEGSWVRVGVGRRESPLNAPCGFDGYSYGYRDRGGEAVTLACPQTYGQPYTSGSTIGIYISLPPRQPPTDRRDPARIVRKRLPIRYKGQLYFELLEYAPTKEMSELTIDPAMKAKVVVEDKKKVAAPGTKAPPALADQGPPLRPLPKLEKAKIAFFLDGVCQGVAFEDIYDFIPLRQHAGEEGFGGGRTKTDPRTNWHDDGTCAYYPHVSVFGGGIATINAGPNFAFPPPPDLEAALRESPHPPRSAPLLDPKAPGAGGGATWRPLSERYPEFLAEQSRLDDLDEEEAVRVFGEQARKEAEMLAKVEEGGGGAGPLKKVKVPARLEELGVVKKEDVHSVGSGSPAPLSAVGEGRRGNGAGLGEGAREREESVQY